MKKKKLFKVYEAIKVQFDNIFFPSTILKFDDNFVYTESCK